MTKTCGVFAGLAFFVLATAAVGLGGLNQDEGWYLYAAKLVREGQLPYRDFFFTQGPVLPVVYARLGWIWVSGGLLAARLLTLAIGLAGILFAVGTVRLLVPESRRAAAGTIVFLLLGCNLYHLYYLAIPKTYALAALLVNIGFFLLVRGGLRQESRPQVVSFFFAGLALGFAAGTRISLGILLATSGFGLLAAFRRYRRGCLWFGLGGLLALAMAYGPFLIDPAAREGLRAAQAYHAARGGFSLVFTIGSLSRLVRWYLPVFILAGLAVAAWRSSARVRETGDDGRACARCHLLLLVLAGFAGVALVQLFAPFPYEDYQVPIMALGTVAVTAALVCSLATDRLPQLLLLTLGLSFATSFGSPLLEKWTTNGQDRFWTRMKACSELAQLREVAAEIERLDPGGKTLFTQDLYLAIETDRKVPRGLEMGPFSMLSDEAWERLLTTTDCPIAAISGYTFAIDPPVCNERDREIYSGMLFSVFERYQVVKEYEHFGQNATWLNLMRLGKEVAE